MAEMTGADAIVESLIRHGVDTVFGLPGVQMYGLFDAFARNKDKIRVINARHEQTVAYMAMGYSYATGQPAVFSVVPGPGVLNTMAALCTAQAVNVPILCLAGQVPSASIGRGRGALHEIPDQLGTIRSLLKWAQRIEHPTQASDLVALAFREMASGRPGPVALEIAPDQLTAVAEVTIQDPLPPPAAVVPDPAGIAAIAELLNKAQAPMLMVGGGALNAAKEIRALAEKLGAPVLANRAGRGVMDDRHPLSVNVASAWPLWEGTDAIVGFGTRMDVQRYGGFAPGQASARIDAEAAFRIFQINLAPLAGGRLNYLRAPSTEAARAYRSGLTVRTETFGTTTYEGRISLLHIDGNHAYESVAADAEAWVPKVKPGGWIVFDDYVWAFGDGPRRVGDAWLQRLGDKVALSFVIGTALFVKLAP